MKYYFEPLTLNDRALMIDWLARPHFLEWWGEPEKEWAFIEASLRDKDCFAFLVYEEKMAVAYIQYWHIGKARGCVEPQEELWLRTLNDQVIGVDMSLAEEGQLGQGKGREILRAFVKKLQDAGFRDIIIDPDIRNLRAIWCYMAAGFERIGQYPEMEGGTLLMRWGG